MFLTANQLQTTFGGRVTPYCLESLVPGPELTSESRDSQTRCPTAPCIVDQRLTKVQYLVSRRMGPGRPKWLDKCFETPKNKKC